MEVADDWQRPMWGGSSWVDETSGAGSDVPEMAYAVSSWTLNSTIPYYGSWDKTSGKRNSECRPCAARER